jgi:hypothetical protein
MPITKMTSFAREKEIIHKAPSMEVEDSSFKSIFLKTGFGIFMGREAQSEAWAKLIGGEVISGKHMCKQFS